MTMRKEAQKRKRDIPEGVSWFAMPSEITLSNELNPYQYRMLAVLLNRDNLFYTRKNLDKFYCSVDWLVSHSKMGKTKAKQTLDQLEEKGFISRIRNGSKHKENIYQINWNFIQSYQRPKTEQELDKEEDLEAQGTIPELDKPTNTGKPSIAEWFQNEGKDVLLKRFHPIADADSSGNRKHYDHFKNLMLTFVCEKVCEESQQEVWDYLLPYYKQYRRQYDERLVKSNPYLDLTNLHKRSFECGE